MRPPLCLAYHGVARVRLRDDPYRLFTAPEALERHIARLRRWGYTLVSFGTLAARVRQGDARGLAALTFDDGFADNHDTLLPLLERLQAAATVFVVSGRLGQPNHAARGHLTLTADQVRDLHARGVEVGAHTESHLDLSTVDYERALAEWLTSRRALEELIEAPVRTAAYPYGRVNEDAVRACRDAGFVAACRTSGEGSWDDPWNLPRQDMINGATGVGLWLKRDDRFEPVVRTLPGRAARGCFHRVQIRLR